MSKYIPDLTNWPPAHNRAYVEEMRQQREKNRREADTMTTGKIQERIANASALIESIALRIGMYCDEYIKQGGAPGHVERYAKMSKQLQQTAGKMAEIAGVKNEQASQEIVNSGN